MTKCIFCKIAAGTTWASILFEDDDFVVFADNEAVRPGHMQIIPRVHFPYFDLLPENLARKIVIVGQRVAKAQKLAYGVERCAFLFTGGDIPHAHAHVYPIHHKHDVTSRRYIVEQNITLRSTRVPNEQLIQETKKLRSFLNP